MEETVRIENREAFKERIRKHFSKQDFEDIMFAYELTKKAHGKKVRDSGERYFEHPRSVALIVLDELKWYNKDAVVTALFHDIGEDETLFGYIKEGWTPFVKTATFRITKASNSNVARMVIGLTKPRVDKALFFTKDEVFSFYVDGFKKDFKLFVLKMADRLHNLRTLDNAIPGKKEKTILETREVYIPIINQFLKETVPTKEELVMFQNIGKMVGMSIVSETYEVICQKWEEEEHEEGYGMSVRPSGYSLHLTLGDVEKFIQKDKKEAPKSAGYYLYPEGIPYTCEVDTKTFKEIEAVAKEGKFGKWFHGQYPVGGKQRAL